MEIDEAINRRSYVSFDMFEAESEVEYCTDQATIFEFIRGRIPNISDDLINELFGEGKNGVRLRSFKRFDSGCLDVAKLKMSQAKIKGVDEPVILIELPCTPSMKSEIYGGALVFSRDGVYLASKSRCDCPNGCYFCSHMLAKFVYFRLIQIRPQWTAEDFKSVMPDPIKSLQGLPIQVQYVFKQEDEQCRIASKIVARELAREVPGYSSNQSSGVDRTEDIEEARAMLDDIERSKLGGGKKVDSISLSDMLDKFLANTKEAVELDTASNCGRKKKSEKAKVKSQDIHAYNQETMNGPLPRIRQQEKIFKAQ
ncbi:hypothetical protein THAOC_17411 [Thalassiosira oceanica]|uniref:SWIM-type domain-containing protein n=1 Tax=Thalassiosira oceanica TaxID=159749 RepID=K0S9P0_THAOC|nr:hypothetical protein THAOC_17411 [Thalassiosira oceanica]|eukprot:EJK62000.1 hypothetical protein THAOC_17411 [Thalassiosira oceanica]